MAKVLVVLADGFEEMEALSPIDLLRRAGAQVLVAGLNKKEIRSSRNIVVVCDDILENTSIEGWDAIVLPGGMPGATNLASSKEVSKRVLKANEDGKYICAICASPAVVLAPLGVLNGQDATCYPGMELKNSNINFLNKSVCISSNKIITARAAGSAVEFALTIVACLFDREKAVEISNSIVCESF